MAISKQQLKWTHMGFVHRIHGTITDTREVLAMLERSASVTLDAYPVSRLVNWPSRDEKLVIQRVE